MTRRLALLALAPVAALVALALAGPILSGDLWWHLRTGEWILEHGELPDVDPFSHTAGDEPWTLQEYGSQVLFALVERAAGLAGLRALGVVLALALLVCVYRTARARVDPPWAAALTALFALLFALKWELRPHLVSAFFVLRIHALLFPPAWGEGRPPGPRAWLEVLVLSCVWVQLHAEALLAPLAAAAGWIGAALGVVWERRGGARRLGAWTAVLAAAVAGTLLSPLGAKPHVYALLRRAVPQLYIEEWFPSWLPPGHERFAPMTSALFAAWLACAALGALFVLRHAFVRLASSGRSRAIAWERIGFFALCLVLSLQARRFVWLAWFPALAVTAAALGHFAPLARARVVPLALALVLALPLAGTLFVERALAAVREGRFADDVHRDMFPADAADFARDAGLAGNLFHRYEWGGYLGYRLGPRCPVFIDGRTVLFEDVIPERWRAEREPDFARLVFDRRDVRVIVLPRLVDHGGGVRAWQPPGAFRDWTKAWTDALATLWIRTDDEANLERVRAEWERAGVAFDARQGILEAQVLAARPDWARARRIVPAEVAGALDAADDGLERARAWLAHRMRRNAREEARRFVDEELAAERRDEARALVEGTDDVGALLDGLERLARSR